MKFLWSDGAQRQFRDIVDYISERSPEAAYRLRDLVFRQTQDLAEIPHLGRPGRVEGTRELVMSGSSYVVGYEVHQVRGEVRILAMIHGARLWPKAFE